jgi:hypothetical protein
MDVESYLLEKQINIFLLPVVYCLFFVRIRQFLLGENYNPLSEGGNS